MRVRFAALGVAAVAGLTTFALAAPAYADTLTDEINGLAVAAEHNDGYDRSLFNHWIDADGDGCDTREEVLLEEAIVAPTIGSGCTLTGGKWYSYYDGATWTDKSDVDIDHMVPLAEAWGSGAHAWTSDQREDFANDLGDPRSLVAVTDNVNSSKGERDPVEWLPDLEVCRYVSEWVAVKVRWKLSVDQAEKAALVDLAADCAGPEPEPTEEPTGEPTSGPTTAPSSSAPPAAAGGGLPITGASLTGFAVGGTLLVGAGCALVLWLRRVRFTA